MRSRFKRNVLLALQAKDPQGLVGEGPITLTQLLPTRVTRPDAVAQERGEQAGWSSDPVCGNGEDVRIRRQEAREAVQSL